MKRSSGSAERSADHSADSSAERLAHRSSHVESTMASLSTHNHSSSAEQPAPSNELQHTRLAVKPKAPPPQIYCAVCNQACGYPLGTVKWSQDEVPVPTCGNICMLTHNSNVVWRSDREDCEDQQAPRWTPTLIKKQLKLFNKGTRLNSEVDSDSDALEDGSAERPVDHSAESSAERPAHHSSDVESTMSKAAGHQDSALDDHHLTSDSHLDALLARQASEAFQAW